MNVAELDDIILAWSIQRKMPLYTKYRGEEVRSFSVVGPSGARAQIWVEADGDIRVNVWNYGKKREILAATRENLAEKLDEALALARMWNTP